MNDCKVPTIHGKGKFKNPIPWLKSHHNQFSTLVPEAFLYSLLANFVTLTSSFNFFLLARSAESREKKASGLDRWEPHFHAISF